MPVSRGGGHSSGGGGGGFHTGGSRGNGPGGYRGPMYSRTKPFPGSRRFYYINSFGLRRHFYYKGTPIKRSLIATIIPSVIFTIISLALCVCMIYVIIPHKLDASKCMYSGEYIKDPNDLFTLEEESAIKTSMEAFYQETGVEPYLYAFDAIDLPSEYGNEITETALEKYANDIYTNTFYDEGHFMILYAETRDSSGNMTAWDWIDCTGFDAIDIVDNDAFDDFIYSMQKYLRSESSQGIAISKAFDDATESIMQPDYPSLVFIVIFFIFFLTIPIVGVVRSAKEIKEVNAYCEYRDSHGGEDFIEADDDIDDVDDVEESEEFFEDDDEESEDEETHDTDDNSDDTDFFD